METYLRDVVNGRHFSWNRSESEKGFQRNGLTSSSSKVEKTARVGALVVVALVVEACSKKGKVNKMSELKIILLGYYIKFGPRNQELRVYFGINGYDMVSR